jgi:hypothetical protein
MTAFTFIIRRLPGAALSAINPILKLNEVAVDTDTNKAKVGDGVTPYNSLAFSANAPGSDDLVNNNDGTYTFESADGHSTTFGGVSVDAGQLLTLGADDKPFLNKAAIEAALGGGGAVSFVKSDGTTPFTGAQSGVAPTLPAHLATKGFVDAATTSLLGLVIKKDGSVDLTGPLVGVAPSLPAHLATKAYVDATGGNALLKSGGALTGPVTTSSTIAGRNVAADGIAQDKLQLLTGVASGSATLGAAIGSTVAANATLLAALQSIVTKLEAVPGSKSSVKPTIAAMQAMTGMGDGDVCYVQNAAGGAGVTSGAAMYVYASGGWNKIAEFESLDLADATTSAHGLMSAADKTKLDFISVTAAANLNTIMTQIAAKLDKSGGTMTGPIAMGGQKITGLAAAAANGDAVRYDEFSSVAATSAQALLRTGGTLQGTLDAGSHPITNLSAPSGPTDAVTKAYADAAVATNATAITAEATARASAVTAEATARAAADSALTASLSTEVSDRTSGDTTNAAAAAAAQSTANAALPKAGGTLTGPLVLSAAPTADLQASTKKYVDDSVASAVTGGTTGLVKADGTVAFTAVQSGVTPTAAAHLATKAFVDAGDATNATAISAEATARAAADTTLTTNLAAEVTARTAGNATNAAAIAAETTRATAAEAAAQTAAVANAKTYTDTTVATEANARTTGDATNAAAAAAAQTTANAALPKSGGTMTGPLVLAAAPSAALEAATKAYVDAQNSGNIKSDGTVAFTAVQSGVTPTAAAHLATKGFVDTGDATNATAIMTEATARAAADATLTTDLASEVTRATTAEATLTTNVATNATAITTEATARTAADATLTTAAAAAQSTADAALPKAGGTMTGAIVLAGAPTADLQASTKKYVDDSVSAAVTGGTTGLVKADGTVPFTAVQSGVTPTAAAHLATKGFVDAGDSTNAAAISAEATARAAADTTLTTNLAAEITRATTAEATNATAITAEATRATAAENLLVKKDGSTAFTGVQTGVTPTAAAHLATKGYVDSADATNASAVTAETTRATAAEGTLTTNLAAETTARIAGNSTNATAITAEATARAAADALLVPKLDIVNDLTTGGAAKPLSASQGVTLKGLVDTAQATATAAATTGDLALKLDKAGGTLTGTLVLAAAPTADLQASTKKYVDDSVASAVTGGTTGLVKADGTVAFTAVQSGVTPTASAHLATKGFVDAGDATNAAAITAEATARTSADATLTTNLATEITARTMADATLVPKTDIASDLVTSAVGKVLAAAQGVALNAADIASGAVVGSNIEITLKGGTKITFDVTALLADIKLQSGTYNTTTKAIEFTLSDASVISVPVSALLPVQSEMSVTGDGSTTKLKLVGDTATPGNSFYYGTDGAAVRGFYALPAGVTAASVAPLDAAATADVGTSTAFARADHKHKLEGSSADLLNDISAGTDGKAYLSLQASKMGVPATGKFIMGWQDGVLSVFPIT